MGIWMLLHYVLSMGLIAFVLAQSFYLYRHFQYRFLLYYTQYLLAVSLYGFFAWSGEFINGCLFQNSPLEAIKVMRPVFVLMAYPFIPLLIYLFFRLIRELLGKSIPPLFTVAYWILWAAISFGTFWGTHSFLEKQQAALFAVMHMIAGIFMLMLRYTALSHLFLRLPQVEDKRMRSIGRFFVVYYTIALTGYFFVTHFAPAIFMLNFLWPILYFSLNIPPLVFLKNQLFRYHLHRFERPDHALKISALYSRFKISRREQDIVQLLLNGKNNREIEKTLFISLGTIKNHTSNIYRKFGVANRNQLINFINNTHET